jgi:CRISPR-associated exonuclease Cas4
VIVDDIPRLTGTQLNYLLICPRKLWLFSHHIEMERESDAVALGQLLHEESFQRQKKELLIDDLIRIDFFDDEAVHDIKKGRSIEAGATGDSAGDATDYRSPNADLPKVQLP